MSWTDSLKNEWEKNPLAVVIVASLASNAAARLVNAWSANKSRRAYTRAVNYRVGK